MTTFTGHRILFVEVWMNRVQSDVEKFEYAFGGSNYKNIQKEFQLERLRLTSITYGGAGRIWGVYLSSG